MAWEDLLTLPLKQATDLLGQPLQPAADPNAFSDEQDRQAYLAALPDFFRQAAAQIAAQQQSSDTIQQGIQMQGALSDAQAESDARQAQRRAEEDAFSQNVAMNEQAQMEQATAERAAAAAAPPASEGPVGQTLHPEMGNATHSLFGHLKDIGSGIADVAKDVVTAPQDIPRDVLHTGEGALSLPGEAVSALPSRVFDIESYPRQLGIPVGPKPLPGTIGEAVNAIPNEPVKFVTQMALQSIPWAPLGGVQKLLGISPFVMDAIFTGDALVQTKPVIDAYMNGEISGKTALKDAALTLGPQAVMLGLARAHGGSEKVPAEDVNAVKEIFGVKAEARTSSPEELQRQATNAGLTRTHEQLAIDRGEIQPGEPTAEPPAPVSAQESANRGNLPSPIGDATEPVTVYHGSGGPIEGNLKRGTFVTTDRAAAEKYASVDAKIRELQGEPATPTVHEYHITKADLGEVPEDATTLGSPFLTRRALGEADRLPPTTEPVAPTEPVRPARPEPSIPAEREFGLPEPSRRVTDTYDGVPREEVHGNANGKIYKNAEGGYDVIDSRWTDVKRGPTKASQGVTHFTNLDDAMQWFEKMTSRPTKMVPGSGKGEFNPREVSPPERIDKGPSWAAGVEDHEIRRALEHNDRALADKTITPEQHKKIADAGNEELGRRARNAAAKVDVVAEAQKVANEHQANEPTTRTPRVLREATETARAAQTFDHAVEATRTEGGATISRTGETTPINGKYLVGDDTPGEQVPFDQFSSQSLIDYIKKHQDRFLDDPRTHMGTEIVYEDGNHHPLAKEDGGIKFVNIDTVTPIADKAEAEALAATLPEGHVHDYTAEGTGVLKDAEGNNVQPVERPPGSELERGPERSLGGKTYGLLNGEDGKFDYGTMGRVAKDWMTRAADVGARVLNAVKELGRKFHSNELGRVLIGKAVRGAPDLVRDDVLDYGGARRWLYPEETKATWAAGMADRLGGTQEFWKSRFGDVRAHVEKMYGLLGTGKQGVTEKGVRFGNKAGPATLERLNTLAEAGRNIHEHGTPIDMARWYTEFWKTMEDHFGADAEMMTRLMAMTQANASPTSGVQLALRAYLHWKMGEPIEHMGNLVVRQKMESFLMGNIPTGDKINPFYEALRQRGATGRNLVAVDRWVIGAVGAAAKGAGMDVKHLQGNSRFIRFTQTLIDQAAKDAGLDPEAYQAAIWGGFRKEWDALLKAAGGKPQGGSNLPFEQLLVNRMNEYSLRSPSDFRLNTKTPMGKMFDADPGLAEVEEWQRQNAEFLRKELHQPGLTPQRTVEVQNQLMYNEYNKKIAASYLLDTGEVPKHLHTPEVIDDVIRTANDAKSVFQDRVRFADSETLKSLTDIPEWQKREITAELDSRARTGEVVEHAWKALPVDTRRHLESLGWMRVPDDPKATATTARLLSELDNIHTEQELVKWMGKKSVAPIVGDKNMFVGKMIKTGEEYIDNAGKSVKKTAPSPYWEPRSFYESNRVLNVERAKADIRARFQDTRPTTGGDTLHLKDAAETLGECGMH